MIIVLKIMNMDLLALSKEALKCLKHFESEYLCINSNDYKLSLKIRLNFETEAKLRGQKHGNQWEEVGGGRGGG